MKAYLVQFKFILSDDHTDFDPSNWDEDALFQVAQSPNVESVWKFTELIPRPETTNEE
jgi:hypothetical protein